MEGNAYLSKKPSVCNSGGGGGAGCLKESLLKFGGASTYRKLAS